MNRHNQFISKLLCLVAVCLATGILLSTPLSAAENWSGFQNGGDVSPLLTGKSIDWQTAPIKLWEQNLIGYGQSSPVVWQEQLYVTTVVGPNKEQCRLAAFDLSSGKQLWQIEQINPTPQESSVYISRAAPTPIADEDGVIALYEGGLLIAADHGGNIRWQRNLVDQYGAIASRHGLAASLEQNGQLAFVWVEREDEPYVLGIEKKTGDLNWKSPGLGVTSWSSPRLIPVPGEQHLVLSGIGKLVGLNPADGQLLWTFTDLTGNSTPTPIPLGPGELLLGASVGRDGGDAGRAAESNGVIELSRNDDRNWQANYRWRAQKATCSFGSPMVAGNNAYFVNKSGVMYVLDLQTGSEKYAGRISNSCWATPIPVENRILFFSKNGELDVVDLVSHDVISHSTFWSQESAPAEMFAGPVLYAAIFAGDKLILRQGDQISCWKWNSTEK